MQRLNNVSVGAKLTGGFLLIALLVIGVAGVGFFGMQSVDAELEGLFADELQHTAEMGRIDAAFYALQGEIHLAALQPDQLARRQQLAAGRIAEIDQQFALVSAKALSAEEAAELDKIRAAWPLYQQAIAAIFAQLQARDDAGAQQAILADGSFTQNGATLAAAIDQMTTLNERSAATARDDADATQNNARAYLLVAALLGFALALGLGIAISRSSTAPLGQVVQAAGGIAEGDLDQRLELQARDELGQLAAAFRQMISYLQAMAQAAQAIAANDLTADVTPRSDKDALGLAFAQMSTNLRAIVGRLAEDAQTVSAASGQLAAAAGQAGQATGQIATTIQQVARGAQQQSEGVTRTAASLEQMKRASDSLAKGAQEQAAAVGQAAAVTGKLSAAIQQVAGNAQAVTKDSAGTAEAAQAGAQTVAETIRGMEAIKAQVSASAVKVKEMGQRSDQIGAIVETIDDIASQTNLLALNAAIEAARAGEHGKGFAVVADEVRKLAERASAATKEIGGLIRGVQQTAGEAVLAMDDGTREVENGAAQAAVAGEALAEILKAAQAVSQQAQAALRSTTEMTDLSNALVSATDTVSAVVEQNTAATEEMAAGSAEVMQAIENIASVSEENSAAVEEVSAGAEEMSAQVEEVTASAQSLAELAQALQGVVGQFTLPAAAPAQARPAGPTTTQPIHRSANGHARGRSPRPAPVSRPA